MECLKDRKNTDWLEHNEKMTEVQNEIGEALMEGPWDIRAG